MALWLKQNIQMHTNQVKLEKSSRGICFYNLLFFVNKLFLLKG